MNKKITLLTSKSCSACNGMKSNILPSLNKLGWETEVLDIDADVKGGSIAIEYGVRSLPFSIVYKEGVEKGNFMGVKSPSQINDMLS